jgi:TnpA family transposase
VYLNQHRNQAISNIESDRKRNMHARRVTLTDRQRDALLRLPVDQGELLRHYTLSDEDLGHIRQRRRAHNRFGFALQLCVLRFPVGCWHRASNPGASDRFYRGPARAERR